MAYDFIGRRTSLTTSAGTTYFHYAGDLLVAESNGSGDVTATYAYAPEGGLISMTRGGSTYYYQTNAQGDVVSLTDSTGAIVDSYGYDPWGKPLSSTGSVTNPFRYAGCYYDGSTGLYYLYHRYYDPATMRFLTLDPASIVTFDRYGYAKDNPVNGADPDGLGLGSTLRAGLDYANVHFNPAYMAINGYYNEVQACEKGCSLSTCLKYGMQGVIGVASTAMLVLPVGEMVGGAIEEALAEGAAEVAPEVAEGSAGVASSRGGVYSLRDAEGNVVRTGRTNNLAARAAAHAKNAVLKQFKFNIEFETDDYATQRGLENVLYNAHPEAQAANGGYNMIRAISPSNPNLGKYLQAAADYLSGLMGQ